MVTIQNISEMIFDFLGDWNDYLPEDHSWKIFLISWEKEDLPGMARSVHKLNEAINNSPFKEFVIDDLEAEEHFMQKASEEGNVEDAKKSFRHLVLEYKSIRTAAQYYLEGYTNLLDNLWDARRSFGLA